MEVKCYSVPGGATKLENSQAKIVAPPSSISYTDIDFEVIRCRECLEECVTNIKKCPYCNGSGYMDWLSMMKYGIKESDFIRTSEIG